MKELKITQSITNRESISLEKYLQEINRLPLISVDEEVELAERIHRGDEAALNELVCANLRFVVSVAKQYQNLGLPLADLINEGNVGLIKAAHKYDETRGNKFISYAVAWIRQSILLAIAEQSRTVRLPLSQNGLILKINSAIAKFEQENERRPTPDELAELLNTTEAKIKATMKASSRHVSFDSPINEDEDSSLLDVIADDRADSADSTVQSESLAAEIVRALNQLCDREREIVKMSFGIGCQEMTLDEISTRFELSRERVRQIRERAIRSLRRQHNTSLMAYLG